MSLRIEFVAAGALALGLLCGPTVSALRQDVMLQYRWTKGEAIRYRIAQVSATTISGLPGMSEMTIDQSTTQVLRTIAEDIGPNGTTMLRQVVESIKMDMSSPMFTTSFDSAKPDAGADPMNAMLKTVLTPMVGATFTMTMAPTGEVQKVEGLSALAAKVFTSVAQDPAAAGVLDGLKANLSDEAMQAMLTQTFAQFPPRPLKLGDTWNSQVAAANPMLGTLVTSVSSTLKAVEGPGSSRIARIATSLTIKQDATKPVPTNPMGMTMQIGEATGDGEQFFATGSGRFQRSTTTVTLPMTMSGSGPDGTPMSLKTSVKTTTTVEIVQ